MVWNGMALDGAGRDAQEPGSASVRLGYTTQHMCCAVLCCAGLSTVCRSDSLGTSAHDISEIDHRLIPFGGAVCCAYTALFCAC